MRALRGSSRSSYTIWSVVCPYLRNSIGGDLDGHVGSIRVGFDGVHGGFGYGSRNQEGEGILNFALAYDLFVVNTLFRKRVSHLVTFSSGQHCSQIDFILTRREDRHACLDCKVIPGECVVPQHKLVVADFHFRFASNGVSASKGQGRSGGNLKKRPRRRLRREFLRRALGIKEVMQIACGWGCPLALEKWHQKSSE
jgi:hypothetical protein